MSNIYYNEPNTTGKVLLETSAGDIEIELWCTEAPLACRNFIQLCMEGYYVGTIFHRVVKDFIIQGGDPTGTGHGGESIYGHTFKDEFHQRLAFNRRGLLGMANAGKDDNGSQFFFTIGTEPNKELNKKHTLFGKVVGATVYNMLAMAECEVDANERPTRPHKITGAKIITNPFDDIVPREKEKRKKEKKKEVKKVESKKLQLLSFGDEAEEDEEELTAVSKSLSGKGKSAHDVLDDERLSKQVAVTRDEMGDYNAEEEREDDSGAADRIRAKFAKKRRAAEEEKNDEKEEDLDEMIVRARDEKKKKEVAELQSELKAMQKQYKKALRRPKEKEEVEEEALPETEAMALYTGMKMKFKGKAKSIVKQRDPKREEQTMSLLERFQRRLGASDQQAILFDKKIELKEEEEEKKKKEDEKEEGDGEEEEGMNFDAEDIEGTDWMKTRFVAPAPDPNITRAKDANMREISEDWYDINDPRNKMNKRRRGEE